LRKVVGRLLIALVLAALVGGAIVGGLSLLETTRRAQSYGCRATLPATGAAARSSSVSYPLSIDQAANASTIAAVGKRKGLPDHAVTIALAAALQESRLHNLTHGDRDSLGLFQQRPSQGWGTEAQVTMPSYAAGAFYDHLVDIQGWETLPVTVAAQRVQRSGLPDAYGDWELEARGLAQVLTGEVPAGLSCELPDPAPSAAATAIEPTIDNELGSGALDTAVDTARGWTVACWMVGRAAEFGITRVSFNGQVWTLSSGHWETSGAVEQVVRVARS
jgi:hypothetical protein